MSRSSRSRMGGGVTQFSGAATMEGASAPLGLLLERSVSERRQPIRLPADFVPPSSVLVYQPKVELISESTARSLRSMLLARDAAVLAEPSRHGSDTPSDTSSSASDAGTVGGLRRPPALQEAQPCVEEPPVAQNPSPPGDGSCVSGWRAAIARRAQALWKRTRDSLPEQVDRPKGGSTAETSSDETAEKDASASINDKKSSVFAAVAGSDTIKSNANGNVSSETESLFTESSSESDADERALGKTAAIPQSASSCGQEGADPEVAEDVAEARAAELSMGMDSPPPLRIVETSDTSFTSEETDSSAPVGSLPAASDASQSGTNGTTTTLKSLPAFIIPSDAISPPAAPWNADADVPPACPPSSADGNFLGVPQEEMLSPTPSARAVVREALRAANDKSASTGVPLTTGSSAPRATAPSPSHSTDSDFIPRSDDVVVDVAGQSSASVAAALGKADVGALRVVRAGGAAVEIRLGIGQPTFSLPGGNHDTTAVGLRRKVSTSSISSIDTVATPPGQDVPVKAKAVSSASDSPLIICRVVSAVPIDPKIPIATLELETLPEARQAVLRRNVYPQQSPATAGHPSEALPQPPVAIRPPEKHVSVRAPESDDDMAEANDSPSEASSRGRKSVPPEKKRKLDPVDEKSRSSDAQRRSPSPEIPSPSPKVTASAKGSEGARLNKKRRRNSSPEEGEVLSDGEALRPLTASLSAPSTWAEKQGAEGRRVARNPILDAGQSPRADIVTRPPVNSEAHLKNVIARVSQKTCDPRLVKPQERITNKISMPSTTFARKSANRKIVSTPTQFKHLAAPSVDATNHKSALEPPTRIAHKPSAAVTSAYRAKKRGVSPSAMQPETEIPPVQPVIPVIRSTFSISSAAVHPVDNPVSAPAASTSFFSSKVPFENGCGGRQLDESLERIATEVASTVITQLRPNIIQRAPHEHSSSSLRPAPIPVPAKDVNSASSLTEGQGFPQRRPEQFAKDGAGGVRPTVAARLAESVAPRSDVLSARSTIPSSLANGLTEKAPLGPVPLAPHPSRVGPADRGVGFHPGLRTKAALKEMEGRAQRPAPWSSQFTEASPAAASPTSASSPHPSDPRLAGKQGTLFFTPGSVIQGQVSGGAPAVAEGRPVGRHLAPEGFALSDLEFHNRILDHLLARTITRTEDGRWGMSDFLVQKPRTQAQESLLKAYYDGAILHMARRLVEEARDMFNKINNHTMKSKPQERSAEEGNMEQEMRLVEDNRHSPEKQNGCARLPRIRLEGSAEVVRCFKTDELVIMEALFKAADTPRASLCLGCVIKASGTEIHVLLSGQSEALHAKQNVKILKKVMPLKLQHYQAKALYRMCRSEKSENPFRQAVVTLDKDCFATQPFDGALLSSVGSFYPRLSARQREIVCNIVQSVREDRPRMLLVQGQPWTGKHFVMTAALRFILRDQSQAQLNKKVLVVLPTDESAARAVRHLWSLWKQMTNETLGLAYLESRKHVDKRVPPTPTDDIAQFLVHHSATRAVISRQKELEGHINRYRQEMHQHLRESEEYRSAEKSLQTFENKLKESKTSQQERAVHEAAVKTALAQCQVLVTSVLQCASTEFQNLTSDFSFACVMLPEAGRSSEVDTIMALTAPVAVNKAILLGCAFEIPVHAEDGHELKRATMDSFLHRAWISQGGARRETALFQSLYSQYVNDPEISAFVAKEFYCDRPVDRQVDKKPEGWPFVAVRMLALPNEASLDESSLVAELVKELLKQNPPAGSITVLTRSSKQACLTRERLKLAVDSETAVRVSAAGHFQGARSHMVILSSAGENLETKWEDVERRRLFVAMTAAAHSLLIVSKTGTIRESAVWLRLEQHLKERRMYVSVPPALAQADQLQREVLLAELVSHYVLRAR